MAYITGYLSFGIIMTYLSIDAIHETIREHNHGRTAEVTACVMLTLFYPLIMLVSAIKKIMAK